MKTTEAEKRRKREEYLKQREKKLRRAMQEAVEAVNRSLERKKPESPVQNQKP